MQHRALFMKRVSFDAADNEGTARTIPVDENDAPVRPSRVIVPWKRPEEKKQTRV